MINPFEVIAVSYTHLELMIAIDTKRLVEGK